MNLRTDSKGVLLSLHFPDRTEAEQGSDCTTGTCWDPNDSGLEGSKGLGGPSEVSLASDEVQTRL